VKALPGSCSRTNTNITPDRTGPTSAVTILQRARRTLASVCTTGALMKPAAVRRKGLVESQPDKSDDQAKLLHD
jgi:hypothetical protein